MKVKKTASLKNYFKRSKYYENIENRSNKRFRCFAIGFPSEHPECRMKNYLPFSHAHLQIERLRLLNGGGHNI